MKFGVRECANIVFRAKAKQKIGNKTFEKGQPVLYIESAKTSTLEGNATTTYATGGRGNTNLVAWEGEKTLTFTVEDALISPIGLSILSGAGLIKADGVKVNVHTTAKVQASATGAIDITDALGGAEFNEDAPYFVMKTEADGSITGEAVSKDGCTVSTAGDKTVITPTSAEGYKNENVIVDFYVKKDSAKVSEIQIDAAHFAGYFYVEAETLFRRQADGVDAPVVITLPNVKIQSNFSFSLSSEGDPTTFTFTMDALPGTTYFDQSKEVLCVMQIVEDTEGSSDEWASVMD